jgi:hypothetical protein
MTRLAAALILALFAAAPLARAQDNSAPDGAWQDDLGEITVIHGPLQPEVEGRVRLYVLTVASNFSGFYPEAEFRNVRAVYFASGSIIICGEINKDMPGGVRSGWHYFTNSGPLIFESDKTEESCDARTYLQQGFADEHEYGPDFTEAAANTNVAPAERSRVSVD